MKKVKLGDVATYINGYAFKPTDWSNEGILIIRIQDLTGNSYQENRYNGSLPKKYEVHKGDVLISWSASLGVYVWEKDPAVLNQHIFKVVFDKENIDKSFFVHQVKHILELASAEAHGATMKHLTKPVFDALPFYLPSIEEQKEIADRLDKVVGLIEKRKEQLAKLDQLVKSRFIEMFDGKYETKSLEAVCEELFAGGDVKKDKSSNEQSDKYPYPIYTNGEKENGLYGYTSLVRVKKEAVTISGRGTIGFTCLRTEPFYPAVRLIVAVPNQKIISGCYLQYFIQSKNYGGQGASIPQLTVPMIKNEQIPVPPIALQNEFAEFVKRTDKSKFEIQQSIDKLETLKKSLMQQYFG